MSEGQQAEPDVPQRNTNNTGLYPSESETDNDDITNIVPNEKAYNQVQKSRPVHGAPAKHITPQAATNGNAPNYQVAQQSRDEIREQMGYRPPVIRESRIKDRPPSKPAGDGSVKVKIELDLEVEVDLYARVKGDVTIGLM